MTAVFDAIGNVILRVVAALVAWLRRVCGWHAPSLAALGTCPCRRCVARREKTKRRRAGDLVRRIKRELAASRTEAKSLLRILEDERAENERLRKHIEHTRPERRRY
jgi:hypothetical protein